MNLAESINKANEKGDIKGIRIMMKNSLLVDPTFIEFSEMESLVKDVTGLYDKHDGRAFQTDKTEWNDDYMNKLMVQVVSNFSTERIAHLKEVVQYLRPMPKENAKILHQTPTGKNEQQIKLVSKAYREKGRDDEQSNRIIYKRTAKIAAGAVVGGVLGGATASFIGGSVLIGAAVGTVAMGAAVVMYTNGR